ncbi:hypothetical protein DL771_008178 [Monosporascus sp. 5C6A]|nr:hypothetical protein DL771_008178 [Monosporascus sp. 5C6A]
MGSGYGDPCDSREGRRAAAPDREASYTEPASHLFPDDPIKVEVDVSEQEPEPEDSFKPLPPLPGVPAESNSLTFRADITGIVLGSLVNAANIYLGLKTGFSFGASMFGAIFGYGFVKLLSTTFAGMPILGMPFGPQERFCGLDLAGFPGRLVSLSSLPLCSAWSPDYGLGFLWDWHIFTWIYIWSDYKSFAINIERWGWFIEWTPAFVGSGLLVGLNVGISYFVGSSIAWGFVGPLLIYTGECEGTQAAPDDPLWQELVTYNGMSGMSDPDYVPSPRYWLLWPGVMVLLCYSMAEFLFNYRILWYGMKYGWKNFATAANAQLAKRGKHVAYFERQAAKENDNTAIAEDFAMPAQQVSSWVWIVGCVAILAVTMVIVEAQFQINAGLCLPAFIPSIIFAFMSIHGAAVTNVTPLTASAKASQLVFGSVIQGQPQINALRTKLIAGAVASAGADMSTTLTSVLDAEATHCGFVVPSVTAWRAVAEAVTLDNIPIPLSSGIFSIVLGVWCVIQVFIKRTWLVGERAKYGKWLPNWMAVAIAFVLPATHYSTAMCMGAIIAHYWLKKYPKNFEVYCYAIAAGLIAGEGLGGVINAPLTLGGVGGSEKGSGVACPAGQC